MASNRSEPISRTYLFVMAVCAPLVRWWGRLSVSGAEQLPGSGPLLLDRRNHDSLWDPVAIGTAGRRHRQIRALAKASLWKIRPLAPILDRMGQVPIERGAGDAGALDAAVATPRAAGACIGVFPEGTISRGAELRARERRRAPRPAGAGGARRLRSDDRHGRHLPASRSARGSRSSSSTRRAANPTGRGRPATSPPAT